ncbi:MAG: hypothetical protein ACP59X_15785 [Solidesulfovibrio sp. DCME]|uniref:hypothetical protein n=1 Tax=Solidesulfovibrio sp. DCME TaxID=3447380 RepID=UPI003D12E54E
MHFEVLVEDLSGQKALEILLPRVIGSEHTYRTHAYKGLGSLQRNLQAHSDPTTKQLLANLPAILRAHGKAYAASPRHYPVIVVCDLDDKCPRAFRRELLAILDVCDPKPHAVFCLAVEEGEAWLLGDLAAVKTAYPKAKNAVLDSYANDAVCGTWELLADALYPGGAKALKKKGSGVAGEQKRQWAEAITPHMDIEHNNSPSFRYFRDKLRQLLAGA